MIRICGGAIWITLYFSQHVCDFVVTFYQFFNTLSDFVVTFHQFFNGNVSKIKRFQFKVWCEVK